MSRHLATVEVDTDRNVHGDDWGSEGERDADRCRDDQVAAYVETLGDTRWDRGRCPWSRVVKVEAVPSTVDKDVSAVDELYGEFCTRCGRRFEEGTLTPLGPGGEVGEEMVCSRCKGTD